MTATPLTYDQLKAALAREKFPLVTCDLDAFDHNVGLLRAWARESGTKMRLCTKSVRVPALIARVLREEFVPGVLIFNAEEASFLTRELGVTDVMTGYPTASPVEVDMLCAAAAEPDTEVTCMVDSRVHLDYLERGAARAGVELATCVDLDVAYRVLGLKLGVKRSPLRDPAGVVALVEAIERDYPHLHFRGLMGYEAQNASQPDASRVVRWVKKKSMRQVHAVRGAAVEALTAAGYPPALVNGGGSGSHPQTSADPVVTEVGIGSALFKSHLFDAMAALSAFQPALYMGLQVVRQPAPGVVTCFGGGIASSGVYAPPVPVLPRGLRVTKLEGFGEVQTPLRTDKVARELQVGDPVFCRFAKAGEPLERFARVHLLVDGVLSETVPTYRGAGVTAGGLNGACDPARPG